MNQNPTIFGECFCVSSEMRPAVVGCLLSVQPFWVLSSVPDRDGVPKNPRGFLLRCAQCAIEESGHHCLSLLLLRVSAEEVLSQPLICFLRWHPVFSRNFASHSSSCRFYSLLQDGTKYAQEALVFVY